MEQDSRYDELLSKYILNELTSDELLFTERWINEDPANKAYFESFRRTFNWLIVNRSMESIAVDEEWVKFEQSVAHGDEGKGVKTHKLSKTIKIWRRIAAAAAVLLLLWGAIWYMNTGSFREKQMIGSRENDEGYITYESGAMEDDKTIAMEDGTIVTLSANSKLTYRYPFVEHRRYVQLKGRAYFQVTRDSLMPFVVHSGSISTTVLGTRFEVIAYGDSTTVNVKLFEGKVVVLPTANTQSFPPGGIFLEPGQELVFDPLNHRVSILDFLARENKKDSGLKQKKISEAQGADDFKENQNAWYQFNNQPLEEVFRQLEDMYHVDIVYTKRDVTNMYFIGRFDKTDSIEGILSAIALLNDLKIRKSGSLYIISK